MSLLICSQRVRSGLSDGNKAKLLEIQSGIKREASTKGIAFGGEIEIQHGYPSLFYRNDSTGLTGCLDLPVTATSAEELLAWAGRNRQLSSHDIGLNFDLAGEILPYIDHKMSCLDPAQKDEDDAMSVVYDTSETIGKTFIMTSELLGLQVFTPGSGLSSSLYSPYTRRVNGFLGNLVIALPCSHEGGQLSVMIRGVSVTFGHRWIWIAVLVSACYFFVGSITPQGWCFFTDECSASNSAVTTGAQLVLVYSVWRRPTEKAIENVIDLTRPRGDGMKNLMKQLASLKLDRDQTFAFGTQHRYPHGKSKRITSKILQGVDRDMVAAAEDLKLDYQLMAVFDTQDDDDDEESQSEDDDPEDEKQSAFSCYLSATSDIEVVCRQIERRFKHECGAQFRDDLIWLSPQGKQWLGGQYLHPDKPPYIGNIYLSWVILITIPASLQT